MGMRKGKGSMISFCYPRDLRGSPQSYSERGDVIKYACVASVND